MMNINTNTKAFEVAYRPLASPEKPFRVIYENGRAMVHLTRDEAEYFGIGEEARQAILNYT